MSRKTLATMKNNMPGEKTKTYHIEESKNLRNKNGVFELTIDGKKTSNLLEINKEITKHFRINFEKDEHIDWDGGQDLLKFIEGRAVFDNKLLVSEINTTEVRKVLGIMKTNKSPGIDGLPSEFYMVFWENISDLFLEMANEVFKKGILGDTQGK